MTYVRSVCSTTRLALGGGAFDVLSSLEFLSSLGFLSSLNLISRSY